MLVRKMISQQNNVKFLFNNNHAFAYSYMMTSIPILRK